MKQLRNHITCPSNDYDLSGYITQFFTWAEEIAYGMTFLAEHGIVHADLACDGDCF